MAKRNTNHEPGAGNGGVVPPVEHRFQPGTSGNPKGRRNAGATIADWMNALAAKELTEADLRKIHGDPKQPQPRRIAAERLLHSLSPDMADYEPFLDGTKTLAELKASGVDTSAVKKAKTRVHTDDKGGTTVIREIELHDHSGAEFDRICDRTNGKPATPLQLMGELPVAVRIITPLTAPRTERQNGNNGSN
jgi:hypothetical protein